LDSVEQKSTELRKKETKKRERESTKDLESVVASITDDRSVQVINSNTTRRLETSKRVALLTKGLCEILVFVKDEYLAFDLVTHDQVAEMVDGDGRRGRDTILIAKRMQGATISVKLVNSLGAFPTHKDVACDGVDRQSRDLFYHRA
jgi:hypothetical protein